MSDNPALSPQEIKQIIEALERSDWDEAVVTVGDVSIALARNGAPLATGGTASSPVAPVAPPTPTRAAPAQAADTAPPAPAVVEAVAEPSSSRDSAAAGVEVRSPTVGIFWRAPEPGVAPFVEVGQRVEAGAIVCIVEVMKLMNNVTAPIAGTVTEILVENSHSVEFDQILLAIAPDAG